MAFSVFCYIWVGRQCFVSKPALSLSRKTLAAIFDAGMRVTVLVFLIIVSKWTLAQVTFSDTSALLKYNKVTYSPRLTTGIQKSSFVEFGFCRRWSNRYDEFGTQNGYTPKSSTAYFGTFISSEIIFRNQEVILGAKLGFETVLVGGASIGIPISIEATNYFYKGNQYFSITPKFILPITRQATPLAFLSYGYCINSFKSFSSVLGNHRFSVIFNVCLNEHKRINKMHRDFSIEVDRIKAKK